MKEEKIVNVIQNINNIFYTLLKIKKEYKIYLFKK